MKKLKRQVLPKRDPIHLTHLLLVRNQLLSSPLFKGGWTPQRFVLSKVQDCPESHRDSYSIFLADLLCPSLGPIAASLQINFMVELDFLTMCYEVHKKAVHISHPGT